MNLNIPEKWESFIRAKMQSGEYASADEVVDEALGLLKQQDMEPDEDEIDPLGIEDLLLEGLNSGPSTPMTAADWESIRREGKRLSAERKSRKTQ